MNNEEKIKSLQNQINILRDELLKQNYKIHELTKYVVNAPCCNHARYVSESGISGAISISEPKFIQDAREESKGAAIGIKTE